MRPTLILLICLLAFPFAGIAHEKDPASTGSGEPATLRALCFSGTGWYRHPDIPAVNRWLVVTGAAHNIAVDVTETPADLSEQRLAGYDVLILNNANTLDKLLDEKQRSTIENWYKNGGAIVALHAALVRQEAWPWLLDLNGCDFNSDSDFLEARVLVDPKAHDHPAVKTDASEFLYTADWTNHTRSVTGLEGVQVLLRVDEKSYEPVRDHFKTRGGKPMGDDHPIAWTRIYGGGRFFYTELGHDVRSLDTEFGIRHIIGGIRWAANRIAPEDAEPAR